jgi:cytochrome bd ubiquinol oxidase subunit I
MNTPDPFLLSRLQFAANISFHILFPSITIALGWLLVFFKLRHHATKEPRWMELYFFFTKIFALTFSLGVVSGVTMSFQFGTNWPGFMNTVGNIAGPLLAYEVLTAFFLEATFLGIMLFGFRRVKPWIHTGATFLVAIGTMLSAFWILVLNSWMHTPAGFKMVDGVAHAVDWKAIIFNPSMPYRFTHTVLASGLTVAFLAAGLLAYRYLRGERSAAVATGLRCAVVLAAVLMPLQLVVGDLHGVNTREYQPQKVAAMEALWESRHGAPLTLFALPDEATRSNRHAIEIPKLGSLIITRDPDGYVQGLNDFPGAHPPVAQVFWSFRVMVGTGMAMLATAWAGLYWLARNREFPRPYHRWLVAMTFSGWVATLAGWYVTEIGRQPWLVQGVLKTRDALSDVPGTQVAGTLFAYLATYAFLLVAYIASLLYLSRKEVASHVDAPPAHP